MNEIPFYAADALYKEMDEVGKPILLSALQPALELVQQSHVHLHNVLADENSTEEQLQQAWSHAADMARLLTKAADAYIESMMDPQTINQYADQVVTEWRQAVLTDLARERSLLLEQLASL